ncbi:hypothetical protein DFH06DRAFT_1228854 [Mycena polygramma]|nr:hypothetical protein DFH06DRAFT_1228854 [Mycena polygramma]
MPPECRLISKAEAYLWLLVRPVSDSVQDFMSTGFGFLSASVYTFSQSFFFSRSRPRWRLYSRAHARKARTPRPRFPTFLLACNTPVNSAAHTKSRRRPGLSRRHNTSCARCCVGTSTLVTPTASSRRKLSSHARSATTTSASHAQTTMYIRYPLWYVPLYFLPSYFALPASLFARRATFSPRRRYRCKCLLDKGRNECGKPVGLKKSSIQNGRRVRA